jgi:hypothetical protein
LVESLQEPAGTISSPLVSGSDHYDNNESTCGHLFFFVCLLENLPFLFGVDCWWLVDVPNAVSVTLDLTSFETEENYDFVTIYDGNTMFSPPMGQSMSGEHPSRAHFVATSGQMLVHFQSDESETADGFRARYSVVQYGGTFALRRDGFMIVWWLMSSGCRALHSHIERRCVGRPAVWRRRRTPAVPSGGNCARRGGPCGGIGRSQHHGCGRHRGVCALSHTAGQPRLVGCPVVRCRCGAVVWWQKLTYRHSSQTRDASGAYVLTLPAGGGSSAWVVAVRRPAAASAPLAPVAVSVTPMSTGLPGACISGGAAVH